MSTPASEPRRDREARPAGPAAVAARGRRPRRGPAPRWGPWAVYGAAAVLVLALAAATSINLLLLIILRRHRGRRRDLRVVPRRRGQPQGARPDGHAHRDQRVRDRGRAARLPAVDRRQPRRGAGSTSRSSPSPRATWSAPAAARTTRSSARWSSPALTTLASVPIGDHGGDLPAASTGTGRLKQALIFFVDVMTGIPSIVAGLFAYALFAIFLGPGVRLGVVGAVALSVLMIPIVVRSTEEMLKIVPNGLREASYALGRAQVAHHPERRAPDRPARHRHRRHGRRVAGHRRDRPPAHHHRHLLDGELEPVRREDAEPASLRLQPVPEPRGAQGPLHRPRLGRGPHADHHRHAAEHDRRLRLPPLRKEAR